ncbi:MAG: Yip1 family protein [Acidobacteria bacterium]|nr:Yip1 family protein [Acidobacteriota bacterium]
MANLQTRVMNILKSPGTEWSVIARESTDVGRLYREYIMILSVIPVVATFIAFSVIGVSIPFAGTFRRPMMSGLSFLLLSYVMNLVGVYVCAVIIEWLAPKFKSSGTRLDALKLVAYAATPVWIAGVFNLLPLLSVVLLLAAVYAVYLVYLGLPVLMKTPADQVVIYMIVAALVIIVVNVVMATMTTGLMPSTSTHVDL